MTTCGNLRQAQSDTFRSKSLVFEFQLQKTLFGNAANDEHDLSPEPRHTRHFFVPLGNRSGISDHAGFDCQLGANGFARKLSIIRLFLPPKP